MKAILASMSEYGLVINGLLRPRPRQEQCIMLPACFSFCVDIMACTGKCGTSKLLCTKNCCTLMYNCECKQAAVCMTQDSHFNFLVEGF